jgi:hypothetical protein
MAISIMKLNSRVDDFTTGVFRSLMKIFSVTNVAMMSIVEHVRDMIISRSVHGSLHICLGTHTVNKTKLTVG